MKAAFLLCLLFTGCAQTVLYSPVTGKRLASFQGDMIGSSYSGGGVTWTVQQVSHSAATLAQGQAAANVITSVGASAAGVALAAGSSGLFGKAAGVVAPPVVNAISNATSKPAVLSAH